MSPSVLTQLLARWYIEVFGNALLPMGRRLISVVQQRQRRRACRPNSHQKSRSKGRVELQLLVAVLVKPQDCHAGVDGSLQIILHRFRRVGKGQPHQVVIALQRLGRARQERGTQSQQLLQKHFIRAQRRVGARKGPPQKVGATAVLGKEQENVLVVPEASRKDKSPMIVEWIVVVCDQRQTRLEPLLDVALAAVLPPQKLQMVGNASGHFPRQVGVPGQQRGETLAENVGAISLARFRNKRQNKTVGV